MDSIQFQDIKMEKPKGIFNFTLTKSLTNLFRLLELLLLLIFISKLSFPSMKLSGDIFKEAAAFLISPRFVFILGNVIVITLFAKSGRHSSSHEPLKVITAAETIEFCEEFVEKSEKKRFETRSDEWRRLSEDKSVDFWRSQSEKSLKPAGRSCSGKVMKRCDSEKRVLGRVKKVKDGMSNEEFKTKIEAFIARQKRIQKDEEHLEI